MKFCALISRHERRNCQFVKVIDSAWVMIKNKLRTYCAEIKFQSSMRLRLGRSDQDEIEFRLMIEYRLGRSGNCRKNGELSQVDRRTHCYWVIYVTAGSLSSERVFLEDLDKTAQFTENMFFKPSEIFSPLQCT